MLSSRWAAVRSCTRCSRLSIPNIPLHPPLAGICLSQCLKWLILVTGRSHDFAWLLQRVGLSLCSCVVCGVSLTAMPSIILSVSVNNLYMPFVHRNCSCYLCPLVFFFFAMHSLTLQELCLARPPIKQQKLIYFGKGLDVCLEKCCLPYFNWQLHVTLIYEESSLELVARI